jgi:hypothetical protein
MSQQYSYDIFISYRHTEKDRAWAKWLLESLETYKVPKALQQKGFPARIGKAFRDEDELPTSADLSTNIQQALEGSKFLVVICSKDTPSSLWVDKEVATFRKLGKGDHIIPLLVEGTPETSFPPSLLSLKKPVKQADGSVIESNEPLEPIAADVRPRADEKLSTLKRLALLRILSAILGCAFDDLRQRDQQRQARKKRILYSVAATLALIIVGGSLYLWDYNRVKVSYYNTMVYRWGVPEGVGPLSNEAVGRRGISYRIESSKGLVRTVQRTNSAGRLRDDERGESLWTMQYRMDGRIEKLTCQNKNGKVLHVKKYDFWTSKSGKPDSAMVDFVNSRLIPLQCGKDGLNREALYFNKSGFVVKELYRNQYGSPKRASDRKYYKLKEDKCYGKTNKVDARGLILAQGVVDISGSPMQDENGIGEVRQRHDAMGNVMELCLVDLNGNATQYLGVSKRINEYDKWGNLISEIELNERGEQVGEKASFMYDARGNNVEESFWDPQNRPIETQYGAKCAKLFDRFGNMVERRFYGKDGKPHHSPWGYGERFSYDDRGNIIESSVLTEDGKLYMKYNDPVYFQFIYDEHGNRTEMRWCDQNRKLVTDKDGIALTRTIYNQYGEATVHSYFDANGKPVNGWDGYARKEMIFDERGYLVREWYFDPAGNPVLIDGCASDSMVYDDRGNMIEILYYGKDARPTLYQGYHRADYKYDQDGHDCEWTFWGIRGEPVVNQDGFSRATVKCDRAGNMLEDSYWGTNGQPVKNSEDYCHGVYTYDRQCRRLTEAYFGTKGQPVLCNMGYHRRLSKYNETGKELELVFFNTSGKPMRERFNKKDGY